MPFSYKKTAAETKQFVRDIRRSNEETRRRWFFGSTAVAMLVIFLLWAAYLNISIPSVQGPAVASSTIPTTFKPDTANEPAKPSFFETLGKGFAIVGNDLKQKYDSFSESVTNTLQSLKSRLEKKNDISIQGANINFAFQGLEKVPPTPLP